MKFPCTGVILAGGLSTRFSRENKALVVLNGKPVIDYVYDIFREIFQDIMLVTNNPELYLDYDLMTVTDIYPVRSSMTGIHTGLFYASTPYAFFAACDTPFLKKEIIQTILEGIDENAGLVIPETHKGFEPLCAAYSKQCLKPIEHCLENKKLKIMRCLRKVRTRIISEKKIVAHDPELLSFFNINTPDDLVIAENLIGNI